jgi:hypothetical protein
MAAGAILPPRFFEPGRDLSQVFATAITCLRAAVQRRSEQPAASISCESVIPTKIMLDKETAARLPAIEHERYR